MAVYAQSTSMVISGRNKETNEWLSEETNKWTNEWVSDEEHHRNNQIYYFKSCASVIKLFSSHTVTPPATYPSSPPTTVRIHPLYTTTLHCCVSSLMFIFYTSKTPVVRDKFSRSATPYARAGGLSLRIPHWLTVCLTSTEPHWLSRYVFILAWEAFVFSAPADCLCWSLMPVEVTVNRTHQKRGAIKMKLDLFCFKCLRSLPLTRWSSLVSIGMVS